MTKSEIPDVADTDLSRDELEEVAAECGIDPDGLDDQQLLERLGVALGELDVSHGDGAETDDPQRTRMADLRSRLAQRLEQAAGRVRSGDANDSDPTDDEQPAVGAPIDGPTRDELRDELRELGLPLGGTKEELQERLDEARRASGGDDDEGGDEQSAVGEPIDGPTRDELRDELRELGLPLTGTKSELQRRLDEAKATSDDEEAPRRDEDGDDEHSGVKAKLGEKLVNIGERLRRADEDEGIAGEDGEEDDDGSRLRDRVADRLDSTAERLRQSGRG